MEDRTAASGEPDYHPFDYSTRFWARLRVKQDALRTEEVYMDWGKRFVVFHSKRHPETLGATAVEAFSRLALSVRVLTTPNRNSGDCFRRAR